MNSAPSRSALWLLMTLLCLAFAPTAAEFYWINATDGTATYARLLAATVSEQYAYGPESGFAVMTPYWRNMPQFNQIVLGVHALLASIVLVIGPFLFSNKVRRRWPTAHRKLGRVYVGLGVPAMLLSMVYLTLTPMDRIYGGPPFAIGLWGIAVLTLYTLVAGAWHIARGEVREHRAVMVLNFSAMLIAPLLRLWWLVLGKVFDGDPSVMQEQTHVAVLMFLGLNTMVGAILVMHLAHQSGHPATQSAAVVRFRQATKNAVPVLKRAALCVGAVAALVVLNQRLLRFMGGVDLLAAYRDANVASHEQAVFNAHRGLFALEALSLSALYLLAPGWLQTLFREGTQGRAHIHGFLALITAVSVAWLGQAFAFGREGTAGWGSAVYWGGLATACLLFAVIAAHASATGAKRAVREMLLHLYALAMTPVVLGLMLLGLLCGGFGWQDAFLSAGVVSTSLVLSASYYHTVYGARSAFSSRRAGRHSQRDPTRRSRARQLAIAISPP